MKRIVFTVAALAAFVASASIASAEGYYGSADARNFNALSDPADVDRGAEEWAAASSRRKTYAWPDQRYYGAHGMVSD
ncbi:MAG: hypothetical protein AB7U61_00225 [Methylocystis sp.]